MIQNMELDKLKIKSTFKVLDSVFIGLFSFQIFLGFTSLFISSNNILPDFNITLSTPFHLTIIINITVIVFVKVLTKLISNKSQLSKVFWEKIRIFKSFSIIRLLLLLLLNLLNISIYLLFSENIILLNFVIILILFYVYRPLLKLFAHETQLTESEKSSILDL